MLSEVSVSLFVGGGIPSSVSQQKKILNLSDSENYCSLNYQCEIIKSDTYRCNNPGKSPQDNECCVVGNQGRSSRDDGGKDLSAQMDGLSTEHVRER